MNARLSIGRILIACFAAAPLLLSGCGGSRAPEPANDAAPAATAAAAPAAAPAATAPAPASSPTRTWADAGGKFQIEAVFVAAEPDRDIVRLKRADGSPFIAPLAAYRRPTSSIWLPPALCSTEPRRRRALRPQQAI